MRKYRLMVVDDNNRDRRVARDMIPFGELGLEAAGEATDGLEALELAGSARPDIVLSDIRMPVMDGIEMARELSARQPGAKIVFMSSYDEFAFAKSAIDMSVCAYILKPLNPAEVAAALRKAVELCEGERRRAAEAEALAAQLEQSLPLLREEFFKEILPAGGSLSEGEMRSRMSFLRIPDADFRHVAALSMSVRAPGHGGGPAGSAAAGAVAAGPAGAGSADASSDAGAMAPAARQIRDSYLSSLSIVNLLLSLARGFTAQVIRNAEREYAILLFFREPDPSACADMALEFVMEAYERLLDRLGVSAVFGISAVAARATDIPLLRRQSEQAVNTRFYSNGNPVILYSEIGRSAGSGQMGRTSQASQAGAPGTAAGRAAGAGASGRAAQAGAGPAGAARRPAAAGAACEAPPDGLGGFGEAALGDPGGLGDPDGLDDSEEAFCLPDLQREIDEHVFMGDADSIDAFVGKYMDGGARARSETYLKCLSYSIVHVLQLMLIQKGLSFRDVIDSEAAIWAKLSAFETILDLRQWLKNIILAVKGHIEDCGGGRRAEVVAAIKDAVAAHYMEPLNVSDIARCAYLGPKQANAIFRKAVGSTIFDYLMSYRMEMAKRLLKGSGDKVAVVAEKVGYANKSHFSLMFRRYAGMTPYEYRSRPVM
ncbi:MAG: response regulator [Clostridiales bacterium]|jgi:YesN/AraC family two-component response regulator|nr:response regulator [Clostridiales bacterium]